MSRKYGIPLTVSCTSHIQLFCRPFETGYRLSHFVLKQHPEILYVCSMGCQLSLWKGKGGALTFLVVGVCSALCWWQLVNYVFFEVRWGILFICNGYRPQRNGVSWLKLRNDSRIQYQLHFQGLCLQFCGKLEYILNFKYLLMSLPAH